MTMPSAQEHRSIFISREQNGSVTLVALCLSAALGIALATYVALCSRAMQLSNRGFQSNASRHAAEAGLEEALRAFNKNTWSNWSSGVSVTWDTTTYASSKRAIGTITFPSGKFGQGLTVTAKIRVDNYDASRLGAEWSSTKKYVAGDTVGYNGMWYRCFLTPSSAGTPPNLNNWYDIGKDALWTWNSSTTYSPGDCVNVSNRWYRCTNTHSNRPPPNAGYWILIDQIYNSVPSSYPSEGLLFASSTWVRLSNSPPWTWDTTTPCAWRWSSGVSYAVGDLITDPSKSNIVWLRCISPHTSNWYPDSYTSATRWQPVTPTSSSTTTGMYWSSTTSYRIGDVVGYAGSWYRCVRDHSGQTPSASSTYWANTPPFLLNWDSSRQYGINDTAYHDGIWYRYINATPTSGNVPTNTSYWASAQNAANQWNRTTSYASGAHAVYGGVWYRCVAANSGQSPNNPSYWTPTWTNSYGITTGAPVAYAEGTVRYADGTTSKTQLRAVLAPIPLFPNAVGATTALTISGSGGIVDSYDSTTGSYSSASATSAAVLAAGTNLTIGGATSVKGYLAWPTPPAGIHTSTTLNGISYSSDSAKARVSRSPYVPNLDILPVRGGTQLTSTTATLGTPGAPVPSVYYYNGTLRLKGASEKITVIGPVVLYITGNLRIDTSTAAKILITSTGSLRLVIARDFNIESSGGGIENQTFDPSKLTVLCSRTGSDTFVYASTQPFYGTIYVPNSSSTLTIGTGTTIYGALSAQNISFSGAANVHYDTSLRHKVIPGVEQTYTPSEVRELVSSTELATLP